VFDVRGLELREVRGRTRLRLRVRAGARGDAILGVHGGALRVGVTAAPERGRANRAVLRLVAAALDLPPSRLELVAGPAAADKVVAIPLAPAEVERRLSRRA
jgi:uncharacterized protein YggU (UPF0235/DUF167 family)